MATVLEAVRNMSNFHLYMTLGTHLAAPISLHMTLPKIYGVTSANNEGWASLLENSRLLAVYCYCHIWRNDDKRGASSYKRP